MNREVLENYTEGSHLDYLIQACNRLEESVGSSLNLAECSALFEIVYLTSFEYSDGFILNGERVDDKSIWLSDASVVAACLYQGSVPYPEWFQDQHQVYKGFGEAYNITRSVLLERILACPGVGVRKYGEEPRASTD